MILLAVSGGIDSMYMANRASELFPGALFAIAHCNFNLRGDESDGDEAFVREWCDRNGIRLHAVRFGTRAIAESEGISIEMAARKLRYEWFRDICIENGYEAVAVAHNANDNAETMLLNLLRGTGSKGVRGMEEAGTLPVEGGERITLLRPLLGTTREQIHSWMVSEGNKWREDRTNAENDVKRNILRNVVFPVFAGINPSFIQTLNSDMQRLRQVDDIAESWFIKEKVDVTAEDGGIIADRLLEKDHWEYLLYRLLEKAALSNETFRKLVELLERFRTEVRGTVTISGKKFESPAGTVKIEKGRIFFLPFPEKSR